MKLAKRLLESARARALLARAAAGYIRLTGGTIHWEIRLPPAVEALRTSGAPFVVCLWHGRLLLASAWARHPRKMRVVISEHRDGLLIAETVRRLGWGVVAGSSSYRGTAALCTAHDCLANGEAVVITPDGPRGPRMRAKQGAVKAAQMSGAPILPVGCAVDRCRVFDSWDRLCVPLPLGCGVVLFGEPITVPRGAGEKECQRLTRQLEDQLNALNAEADRRCGRSAIEPAPGEAERAGA